MKARHWFRPSRVLLAILVLGTLLAMILSGRPWRGYSMPRVEQIAALPDSPQLAPVRRYTEIGSGLFPYIGGPRPDRNGRRPELKLGFAYEEQGILGMPYWVSDEYGLVTYLETEPGIQFAMIGPGQRPLLDGMLGRPVTQQYRFRWYRHLWGWLFPLAFLIWIFLWRREDQQEEQRLLEAGWEG
jgi:hypothetical protein